MRVTSVLLAILVIAGLAVWFAPAPQGGSGKSALSATVARGSEGTGDADRQAQEAVPVMVLETRAEQTVGQLIVRGRTMANRKVEVRAETTGLVVSEPLRRGTEVAAGDLLCRLDPGSRPAQLAEAKARLAEARAEANAAEQLVAKGFTSKTTRMTRQAELEAAEAAVDLVKLDIARLAIHAPFDGVLESDTAELGSRLAPGDLCATVIDLSRVKVVGYVGEQGVGQITPTQRATARLIDGRRVEGSITFIGRVADPQTRTYEVEVSLPNPDGQIRDGMTAEIAIALPPETAHRIPQSALTLDDEGRLGVRLAVEGRARFAPVKILRDQSDGVWVTGLPETAQVIVIGQEFVRDGRAIRAKTVSWEDLG